MIYQPRNVQPSNISIDGNEDNVFSLEVNTNTSITGYKLIILNSDNTPFYTGTKVVLANAIYNGDELEISVPNTISLVNGNDYKWKVRLYQDVANMLITYGTVQSNDDDTTNIYLQKNINIKADMILSIGGETKTISSYDIDTGVAVVSSAFATEPELGDSYQVLSDFLETNPEYIVYVRETPTVTITAIPSNIITQKYYEFTGTYTQADGVPLIYHQWDLYLYSNGEYNLVKSSDKTYSANILFYYDGFKTGQTYGIQLTIETEYGVVADSGLQIFSISYDVLEYSQKPTTKLLSDKHAIQVDWMVSTSFEPYTINLDTINGLIQPGTSTTTLIYLDKGLTIFPGYNISINSIDESIISSYDGYTGVAILSTPLSSAPEAGDIYEIIEPQQNGIVGTTLLNDTPYIGTNSLQLNSYSLLYNDNNGIGVMPDDYNITAQFLLNDNFFYGTNGVYNDIMPIIDIITTESNDLGNISILAHKYKIIALKPDTTPEGDLNLLTIASPPIGEENTSEHIYISESIDLEEQSYITFVDYNYTENIISFDSGTGLVTFNKALPFTPETGDYIYLNNTLSDDFYDSINNVFVLQSTAIPLSINDYVWDDTQTWNDLYYWVEGGTEIERIANIYWKMRLTNDTITVIEGGV